MRTLGVTARATVGGDQSRGPQSGNYTTLPANSILTPDDPSTPEEREIITFAWLGGLFGLFIALLGGLYFLFTT